MKKLRFIFILSLLMVFCFSLGQVFTTAQTDEAEADWDVNNTVTLTVKAEYVDEVLKDIPGAFSKIDFKTAYITGMAENEHLCMIIVLNNSGDAQQQAAADILSADPRFKFVHKSCDAPFKTENTLHLVASANSVNAKKTFTIKPEGTLKVYEQLMDYTRILVSLKNYDPKRIYTSRLSSI
ncbi:MAG: hypothetical protein DBX47_07745 [Clostridiales bacterium]|nr:MAG: hypothetical protein DBX47_07745 [Clostridiales bacterium]